MELEKALSQLFQKKIKSNGSSRTDSGVHAEGQVVNFQVKSNLPLIKIQLGLNHYLPVDVSVIHIAEAPKSFHAQYSAKWKLYEYCVYHSRYRSPLKRERTYQFPHPLNISKMRQAAKKLCGRHDFRAFESSGGRRISAVRTIRRFQILKKGNVIFFLVEANGFLYKMVRSLVGTVVQVGCGRRKLDDLKVLLETKNRNLAGNTLPPQALTLKKITF